ncbi:MAG: RibD family protein [Candidatus Hodarchaeota archaeon]
MNSLEPHFQRPFVTLSAAISLDGFIATIKGDSELSNSKDWARVHQLRMDSDAIMVGGGTIRADDSKLTVNEKKLKKKAINHPIRLVVSSKGNIPINARVITYRPEIPTLIAITSQCPSKKRLKLEEKGCELIECGDGPLVNLKQLLGILKKDFNINTLMLEGGSRLNGEMLNQCFIDEVHLAFAPVICGSGIPLFALPKTILNFSDSPYFEIITYSQLDDMIFIQMSVHYQPRQIK